MCVPLHDCARLTLYRACHASAVWCVNACWNRAGARMQVPAVVRAMAIPALTSMLASGTEDDDNVENALHALRVICAAPEGRDAAVAAGVPAVVTAAMVMRNASARCDAALVLSEMCVTSWARACVVAC